MERMMITSRWSSWNRLRVAAVTSLLSSVSEPYGGASVRRLGSLINVVSVPQVLRQPLTYIFQMHIAL